MHVLARSHDAKLALTLILNICVFSHSWYEMGQSISARLKSYAVNGHTWDMEEAQEQCHDKGECSKLQKLNCRMSGQVCWAEGWVQAETQHAKLSVAMRASHTPDWCDTATSAPVIVSQSMLMPH
jgi:Spondin_N